MSGRITVLNLHTTYESNDDAFIINTFDKIAKDISAITDDDEFVRVSVCKLYRRMNFRECCAMVTLERTYDKIPDDIDEFSMSVKFTGPVVNFTALFKPNGNLRISAGTTDLVQATNIRSQIQQHLLVMLDRLENIFNITCDKTDYSVNMLNCVYYIDHNIKQTEQSAIDIQDTMLFPRVMLPDYTGTAAVILYVIDFNICCARGASQERGNSNVPEQYLQGRHDSSKQEELPPYRLQQHRKR